MNRQPVSKETSSSAHFDDTRLEQIMGRLLQVGVMAAALIVLAGGVLYVHSHAGEPRSYATFLARPLQVTHPSLLAGRLISGDASAIIDIGILVLIATPIARVLFAVIAFAIERDRLYVAVSVVVLAVLLLGIFSGH